MHIEETRGKFGFHLIDGQEDPHLAGPVVQMYVKSSALSRTADLAISPRMTSQTQIDQFIDDAIEALQIVRTDAKKALEHASAV